MSKHGDESWRRALRSGALVGQPCRVVARGQDGWVAFDTPDGDHKVVWLPKGMVMVVVGDTKNGCVLGVPEEAIVTKEAGND
jgi:hypothetical protein